MSCRRVRVVSTCFAGLVVLGGCGSEPPPRLKKATVEVAVERAVGAREPRPVTASCALSYDAQGATCALRDPTGRRGVASVERDEGTPGRPSVRVAPNRYVGGTKGEAASIGTSWLWNVSPDGIAKGRADVEMGEDGERGITTSFNAQVGLVLKALGSAERPLVSCPPPPPVGDTVVCGVSPAPLRAFRMTRVDAQTVEFRMRVGRDEPGDDVGERPE